jgi:N-acetylglucosamine-6-phosphate deacetylase
MAGAITNARVLTPDESFEPGSIVIDDDGRIAAVGADLEPPPRMEITDGRGLTLVPGYIDIHVHGGGGFSLATDDPEEIRSYARWVVSHGVTSFVATICAGTLQEGLGFVRTAAASTGVVEGGANILGVNLEGPFVSPERRGALPAGWPAPADVREFERLVRAAGGRLRFMTLAPEVVNAEKVISTAVERGVAVSVGHSNAGYDTALFAFGSGASHVTHAFNAMRPFHHRDPGVVGAALDSPRVTVEVIADGVHVHPATVNMLVKAFTPDRIALITDGVPPAGFDRGKFRLGDEEATLAGNRVLLPDGTIAGSAATMAGIVRNVVKWGVADLSDAVRMASTVPARVVGLSERKGRLATGYDADIIALDNDIKVVMTWVGGRLAYKRG